MTEEIRRACRLAVEAGYRNIDIDSSTLVDLSKPNVDEEQRENYRRAAELTALIRTLETDGVTISVGGEIGEVGTQNSTVAELRAYLDGYRRELDARAPGRQGHLQGQRPDRDLARRRAAARRRRGRGQARLRGPPRARRRRPRVRAGRRRPARRVHPARRAVPPLPGGRDGRDPPRDRVPERALRAPGLPGVAPSRDRGVVLRQRRRRAQGRPDRPAVRLHDAQEGDRAVQAAALGARRRRTRSSPSQRRKIAYLFTELRVNDSRAMVDRYIHPVEAPPSPTPGRRLRGGASPRAETAGFDRAGTRCYPPAQVRRRIEGVRRGSSPAFPVCQLQRTARTRAVRWEEEISWRDQAVRQDVVARDDAHLRSLGIKPELSAASGSCRSSRSRSATSACRPARSRTRRSPSASAASRSSGRGRSSSSARPSSP